MSITAYKIVTGSHAASLGDLVASTINTWQPLGGPINMNGYLAQALIQGAPSEGVPPDSVPLANGDHVTVKNSAGTTVAGMHTAEVASGALTDVKLAATIAPVASGLALTGVAPSGSYATTVTFTVANGVITAIALS